MLISEAVGDVMRATNDTLLGGIIAAVTLMLINKVLEIAEFKFPRFGMFMEGRPAVLIRNGEIHKKEMKRTALLRVTLNRRKGERYRGHSEIKLAILETDGRSASWIPLRLYFFGRDRQIAIPQYSQIEGGYLHRQLITPI